MKPRYPIDLALNAMEQAIEGGDAEEICLASRLVRVDAVNTHRLYPEEWEDEERRGRCLELFEQAMAYLATIDKPDEMEALAKDRIHMRMETMFPGEAATYGPVEIGKEIEVAF